LFDQSNFVLFWLMLLVVVIENRYAGSRVFLSLWWWSWNSAT